MKKNIFLVMTLTISTLLAEPHNANEDRIALLATIKQEAQQAIWNNNALTPEQLQLLLNYTHTSFEIVSTEHKLQEEATFLLLMGWHLRYDRETFSNNPEHLLAIERSFERFKNLMQAQNSLTQTHEQLEEHITKPENKAVAAIAQTMVEHTTQLIKHFSCTQGSSITQTLTECV